MNIEKTQTKIYTILPRTMADNKNTYSLSVQAGFATLQVSALEDVHVDKVYIPLAALIELVDAAQED